MEIQALGYVGLGSAKLDEWSDFATRWLGMQAAGRGRRVRSFRMDDRKQRLIVDAAIPEGQHYFGWEVANAKALDRALVFIRKSSDWRSCNGCRGHAIHLYKMRWIKILCGNLVVFGIIFGGLEIAVRVYAPDYANAYFDADVTRGYPIYLNRKWGLRVAKDQVNESFEGKGEAVKRVLFAGDSVTFGYGLPYEAAYHQVANRRLASAGCSVQVVGLGRLHTNLTKLLNSDLGDFVWLGYRPQILIYQFQANDVPLNEARRKSNSEQTWRDKVEKFRITYINRSAFLKWVQSVSWQFIRRQRKASLSDDLIYAEDSNPPLYRKSWEVFEAELLKTRAKLAVNGIELRIMIAPESYDVSATQIDNDLGFDLTAVKIWPAERVRRIAYRDGIPLFDPTPALRHFRSTHPNKRLYFPNDPSHPNLHGHELIGQAAADYIRTLPGVCE